RVAEAIFARELDGDVFAERLEGERDLAGLDGRAAWQEHFTHAVAVDERAVGRAEVAQQEADRRRLDIEVVARDRLVGDAQRVSLFRADPQDLAGAFDAFTAVDAPPVALGEAHQRALVGANRTRFFFAHFSSTASRFASPAFSSTVSSLGTRNSPRSVPSTRTVWRPGSSSRPSTGVWRTYLPSTNSLASTSLDTLSRAACGRRGWCTRA